jgi:signal transduction histidine kinase
VTLRSLRARLARLGAGAILLALLGAGVAIDRLLDRAVDRSFAERMDSVLLALFARVDADATIEEVRSAVPPADPRFDQQLAGWYWQVEAGGAPVLRSRSLFDGRIVGGVGPRGEALVARAQDFSIPGHDGTLRAVVAGPAAESEAARAEFAGPLRMSLLLLGVALLGAFLVQVGFGLAPLGVLRRDLAAVRRGALPRLPPARHAEVAPLVESLNALLDHKAAMLERARRHAGNLAHGLQTPVAALANIAAAPGRDPDGELSALIGRMRGQLRRHLARARAAASAGRPGARCPVAPVLDDLALVMRAAHPGRRIILEAAGAPDFAGERGDLEEMAGNLMDNACKWARGTLRVSALAADRRLLLCIADDGPGMSEADFHAALARGRRLDEAVPSHGLGLAIVVETADLYGGALARGASDGGLVVELRLPAA